MIFLHSLIDLVLHLDIHLATLVNSVGDWSYAILFIIIFAETGLVVLPFLPGDALLFTAGSIATISNLNPHLLILVMITAAILGNTSNYFIGRWLGHRLFTNPHSKIFKQSYLHQAHEFYEQHGAMAIITSRFLPIIRTFVPFVAGIAEMTYRRFTLFNMIGAILWVGLLVYMGYYFGQIPFVKANFGLVIIAITVISLIPLLIEISKAIWKSKC